MSHLLDPGRAGLLPLATLVPLAQLPALAAGAALAPAPLESGLLARGGGFGAGRSGLQDGGGDGGFNRGAARPSGGWANSVDDRAPAPSLDGGWQRSGSAAGSWADRGANRTATVSSSWNRDVNVNTINVSPGWARPGWGYARPWNVGWYGGFGAPAWGWWGPCGGCGLPPGATARAGSDGRRCPPPPPTFLLATEAR
jgi:hypothetical protein